MTIDAGTLRSSDFRKVDTAFPSCETNHGSSPCPDQSVWEASVPSASIPE